MRRGNLFAIPALMVAINAFAVLAQEGVADDDALSVTVTLEDASRRRANASSIRLPVEEGARSAAPASEQRGRFQPADFARPNRLEGLQIDARDLPRGAKAVAVRCQAVIGRGGELGEYHCLADDNRAYEDVINAVIDTVPTQRFVAARVDGESVPVVMNFAVYLDCTSGSCVAVAGRNHGYQAQQLGLDYVAPQPIVSRAPWYEGFTYKLSWARDWMPRIGNADNWDIYARLPYVMAVDVDASGVAGSGCLYYLGISNSQASPGSFMGAPTIPTRTKSDLENAIRSLRNVRYVPGMINGMPIPLRLYEESVAKLPYAPAPGLGPLAGVGDIDCK